MDRQLVDEKIELVKNSSIINLTIESRRRIKSASADLARSFGRFTTLPDGVKFLVDMRTECYLLVKSIQK